ncbi:alpha/beta hydrolase [Plantactinospora siamensis]|uniref:Alpha/beta hydrolase n=1 Tax=Plantactinospora siamensis TaxID=555372 RepID=A0ABV6P7V1_9ACTN
MAPDSAGAELVAAGLAVAAVVALALTWDTGRGWRRAALRSVALLLCLATTSATALLWLNRQVETYPTWSDLFGGGGDVAATHAAITPVGAPSGRRAGRVVRLTVAGRTSHLTMPVYAYLPADYGRRPAERYPVIEALHGFPGSPMSWLRRLGVSTMLDREIAAGRMAPTVVLFPYITPDPARDTECTNLVHGPAAETFLTVDVPSAVESQLRVRQDRAGWGLIGYSAGGFCATNLVLRHPTRYAAGASLSGYSDPGIVVGDGSEHTFNNDDWRLRHLPVPAVALYLACARSDPTAMRDTAALAGLVRAPATVTTEYVDTGGHNGPTWEAMEPPAFDWLSGWLGRPEG